MRETAFILAFFLYIPTVFADTGKCETALIGAIKTEEDITAGEDWLFQASERAEMPQDMGWLKRTLEQILQSKDRLGPEATFSLLTALLAGLDPQVFMDPQFEKDFLKPWAALRREARQVWTSTPPRYNIRLMFKLSAGPPLQLSVFLTRLAPLLMMGSKAGRHVNHHAKFRRQITVDQNESQDGRAAEVSLTSISSRSVCKS